MINLKGENDDQWKAAKKRLTIKLIEKIVLLQLEWKSGNLFSLMCVN